MRKKLAGYISSVKPLDEKAMQEAKARQESLAKPPGSLGKLEDISIKMAGITGSVISDISKGCVAVFCSDNGVWHEGVACTPQSVTMAQTVNFTRRLTGVGVLCESFGSDLLIVDMGVKDDIPEYLYTDTPLSDTRKIVNRKIRRGTSNIAQGPAMTEDEAFAAVLTGIEMAEAVKAKGFDILGTGEMGIGNTTTSAAVISALTGKDSSFTCGRGGGLNDEGFARKKEIVDDVTLEYREKGGIIEMIKSGKISEDEAAGKVIEVLAGMGGFDICAMTGAFIGAAALKMPVVIDGYISAAAALAAFVMAPLSTGYMFASHRSFEKGYMLAVDALGLSPFLDLDMRLGEGSGCPIAFEVIRGACDVMKNMATFDEAEINDSYLEEIRKGNCF